MDAPIDSAAPIRPGEELPLDRLSAYLNERWPGGGPLAVEQFPHGHSNLTYLIRWGDQEWVLRRPPFGNVVKTAHDMSREFRILSRLSPVFSAAPRPECFCDDPAVLGAPFYLMERRQGLVLRRSLPPGLSLSPDAVRSLSLAVVDNLAALHALDYRQVGLEDFGKPDGYLERQVSGWTRRLADARTAEIPALDRVATWLAAHLPGSSSASIVHNDYKYDNLLLDAAEPTRIVALLDWEMATIGDPLLDLGTSLGYWVGADDPEALRRTAFGPTALPGSLTRKEVVERYEQQSGRRIDRVEFYYCFGLFKIAVIVQQIYARFVRGHTSDPRFAHLDQLVTTLADQAERAIAR